jgi:DNA-binding NarL/FixJ family response regulator
MRSVVLSRERKAQYPGVFQELAQIIGADATGILVAHYGGGAPLYIPHKAKPNHPISLLLGQEVAQQLADELGGLTVEIPRDVAFKNKQRDTLILADRAAGMSQNDVARKYQLTVRTIRKITSSTRNTTQP